MPTIEEQRRALNETIAHLRTGYAEQGEALARNTAAVEDLAKGLQAVQQAQVEASRAAAERDIQGSERELRRYEVAPEEAADIHSARACVVTEEGAVRLVGTSTPTSGYEPGLLDDTPRTEWQRDLQDATSRYAMIRTLCRQEIAQGRAPVALQAAEARVARLLRVAPAGQRRIFTSALATQGGNWIPDQNGELEREVQHQTGIHRLFVERPVGPGGTLIQPWAEGMVRPFIGQVPTTNDPAGATLGGHVARRNTIDTVELPSALQFHRDSLEDATLVDALPEGIMRMAMGIAAARDDIAINGDSTAAHQDAIASWNTRGIWLDDANPVPLGTSADHRRMAKGLRRRSRDLTAHSDGSAAQTATGWRLLLKALGPEYYARMGTGDIAIIISPEYFLGKALGFTDLITWDKAGPAATILTGLLGGRAGPRPGSVGSVFGVEVCVTPFLTADLADTGLFTGTGAYTSEVAVATSDFEWRIRKGVTLEQEDSIRNNTRTIVARTRLNFRTRANDTTRARKNVASRYKMDG